MVFFLSKEKAAFNTTSISYVGWRAEVFDASTVFICDRHSYTEKENQFGLEKNIIMLNRFVDIGNLLFEQCLSDYVDINNENTFCIDEDGIISILSDSSFYFFQQEDVKKNLIKMIMQFINEFGYYESPETIESYSLLKDGLLEHIDEKYGYRKKRSETVELKGDALNIELFPTPSIDVIPAWHIAQSFFTLFLKYSKPSVYFEIIGLFPTTKQQVIMGDLTLDVLFDSDTNSYDIRYRAGGTLELLELLLLETHSESSKITIKNCKSCGTAFVAENNKMLFCGFNCKNKFFVRANRERKKEEKANGNS